jgi:hypothetical protein
MFAKQLFMFAVALLVLNGVVVAAYSFTRKRFDFVSALSIVVGLAALFVGLRRDSYLPFLGETVLPCSLLKEQTPEHADTEVRIHGVSPNAKVLYWAAEPATEGLQRINNWQRAYLDFANAGVTTADSSGYATLRIRKPQSYTIPSGRRLNAHVHWRVCGDGGMIGPVQTTMITGGPI